MDKKPFSEKIKLTGFKVVDAETKETIDEMIEKYGVKFERLCENLQNLSIQLKQIHESEKTGKFEIQAKLLDNGKVFPAEHTDRNVFAAVDKVLSIIENDLRKK